MRRAVSADDIGFPFAAQCARVLRQHEGRKNEEVALITDLETNELSALQWLTANRSGWGIENGNFQRLDVTLNEDRCRVRSGKGQLVLGLFRRLVVSLYMEWRLQQPKSHQKSLTDFQSLMGENNLTKAMSLVTSLHPKFH